MALNKRALVLYCSVPHTADAAPVNFYKYAHGVDAMATIIAAGYFNDVRDKLKVNDHISFMAVAAGTGNYGEATVTAVPATGNVTVAVDAAGV
jgi:hypothetical protein